MRYAPGTILRFTLKVARRGDYVRGATIDLDHDDPRVSVFEGDPAWSSPQVVRGHGPGAARASAVPPRAEQLRDELEGLLERHALAIDNADPEVQRAYAQECFARGSFLVELIRRAVGDRYMPALRAGVDELADDLFGDDAPLVPSTGSNIDTDPGDLGQEEPAPAAPVAPARPVAQPAPAPDLGPDQGQADNAPVERKPMPAEGPVAALAAMLDGGAVPAKGATLAAMEDAGFQVQPAYRRLTVAELAEKARELLAAAYIVPTLGTDPGDLGQDEPAPPADQASGADTAT